MSKQPALDPAEALFRDLRGAIYRGDGRAALGAIERALDLDALQYVGDGLVMALAQGVPDVTARAAECATALRRRDLDGDEDLAVEFEAALGLVQPRALRDIPVDLDELSLALEGDSLLTGGRLNLRTGEVQQIGPLYKRDYDDEFGEPDEEEDGWLGDLDDGQEERRWLDFDSLGSRAGFRDMEEFLGTVTEERLTARLDRALGGRGAFRRFKDELADAPGELARFFRFTDDRCWRARPPAARRIGAAPERARGRGTGRSRSRPAPLTGADTPRHLGARPTPARLGRRRRILRGAPATAGTAGLHCAAPPVDIHCRSRGWRDHGCRFGRGALGRRRPPEPAHALAPW
jgi:hypothetical protein